MKLRFDVIVFLFLSSGKSFLSASSIIATSVMFLHFNLPARNSFRFVSDFTPVMPNTRFLAVFSLIGKGESLATTGTILFAAYPLFKSAFITALLASLSQRVPLPLVRLLSITCFASSTNSSATFLTAVSSTLMPDSFSILYKISAFCSVCFISSSFGLSGEYFLIREAISSLLQPFSMSLLAIMVSFWLCLYSTISSLLLKILP